MKSWEYKPAGDFGLPPGEGLKSLRREAGLASFLVQRMWWATVRSYLAVGHRLSIAGRENLPARPPYVLVANHASHLDIMALAAAVPAAFRHRVFPIAAGDTFFVTRARSAFSAIALNALPMWRDKCGRHALGEMRARLLEEACVYVLFPEGTRSRSGEVAPFKPGVGMFMAETPVPVVPCRLRGTFEAWPPKRRVPRPRKIRLRIGTPLCYEDCANNRAGWETIARSLRDAVMAL